MTVGMHLMNGEGTFTLLATGGEELLGHPGGQGPFPIWRFWCFYGCTMAVKKLGEVPQSDMFCPWSLRMSSSSHALSIFWRFVSKKAHVQIYSGSTGSPAGGVGVCVLYELREPFPIFDGSDLVL